MPLQSTVRCLHVNSDDTRTQWVVGTPLNADKISWGRIIIAVDTDIVARYVHWNCIYKLNKSDMHVITIGLHPFFLFFCYNSTRKVDAIPSSGKGMLMKTTSNRLLHWVNLCSRRYLMSEAALASETSCLNKKRYDEKGPFLVRSTIFWDVMQLWMVTCYRLFRAT